MFGQVNCDACDEIGSQMITFAGIAVCENCGCPYDRQGNSTKLTTDELEYYREFIDTQEEDDITVENSNDAIEVLKSFADYLDANDYGKLEDDWFYNR